MTYNLTGIMAGNESGILDFVLDVDRILLGNGTSGLLGTLFLMAFSVILFSSFWMSTGDVPKTLMGTFMIIFVLSISFVALGIAHPIIPFVAGTFLVLGIVFSYSSKQ